jgi:hypothetical protein
MPQRFLRPGITTSDAWNAVSFPAQSFYIRLLTLVDDWGRYDGRVPVLHGQCFALRSDIVPQETAALRSELHAAGLIEVYAVEGKEYVQITKWQERARGTNSRYPAPCDGTLSQEVAENVATPQESAAERCEPLPNPASITPSPIPITPISTTPSPLHQPAAQMALPFESEAFCKAWESWEQHRREIKKKLTPTAAVKLLDKMRGMGEARAIAAINHSIANGWTGLFEEEQSGKPPTQSGKPRSQFATW